MDKKHLVKNTSRPTPPSKKTKLVSPVKASTQAFVGIEDIRDDILVLKDYSCVIIIEVGAVNFWLLSQEEQESMIYAYASLLNSLSFPVQILILSKKMDISSYLEYLNNKIKSKKNDLLRTRLINYMDFIKNIVKKNTVLQRRFFFVIPFSPLEMGVTGVNVKKLNKEYVVSRAKTALYPKRDNLIRLLAKTGLRGVVLQKQELVELFYNLYNPSTTGRQLAPIDTYTDVIVTSG